MDADLDTLVARVKERAGTIAYPPLSEREIVSAERRLGFALPPSLRALYARVGNGGYGPAYGLLGLVGGELQEDDLDTVGVYERARIDDAEDPEWSWPEKLLPVLSLGCAMFFCVDCSSSRGDVVWFEPNGHGPGTAWHHAFIPLGLRCDEMMLRWVAGDDELSLMAAAKNRRTEPR
jgi:hypothetical protein